MDNRARNGFSSVIITYLSVSSTSGGVPVYRFLAVAVAVAVAVVLLLLMDEASSANRTPLLLLLLPVEKCLIMRENGEELVDDEV